MFENWFFLPNATATFTVNTIVPKQMKNRDTSLLQFDIQ